MPSYDDLTPPIPDVLASESVAQLTLFLGGSIKPAAGAQQSERPERREPRPETPAVASRSSLYACLKGQGDAGEALVAIARDFSPRIMRVAPGEVLIDVAGLGRLIGDAEAIARELRRAVQDARVTAAVAVAETQTTARVLARAPEAREIGTLPIDLLRDLEALPPAMGLRDRERPYETLERWGIATLAAFAALPAPDLSSRLGRRGVALQRLARGLDLRPFVPDADTPRYIERLELECPIDSLEPLSFVFARLLEPLAAALERADRGAAAVRLDLRLTDRSTYQRVLQLPAPMRDPRVLRTLLLLDLESHPPFGLPGPASEGRREPPRSGGPSEVMIDVVEIEVDPAPSRITQFSLLERAVPSPETVSTLMARLSALVGDARVGSPVVVDSHRPDAFEMRPFTAAPAAARAVERSRPDALVLRRQRLPPAIRVNVSNGRPVYIAPSRRGIPSGAIVQSAGPWRTSGGWWADLQELPAKAGSSGDGAGSPPQSKWDRNEWDVALAGGTVCRIFQDRTTDRWFLEATYD